ncbi:MAG: glycosyltransferase [Acutalibacteraceae bacterium]|nr:glycosyltransferase [Acutalibacteraceae bacterium]
MSLLSFVIPCYGSENTINAVIDEIISVVSQKQEYDYEIIAVNDQSPDNVINVLKLIAAKNKKVKVIDLAKNFGKHSAVMAGFSQVKGEYIICLDDDGQCPMDRLWDLLEPVEKGEADYSMADYAVKKQSKFKNLGSAANSLMSYILLNKPKDMHFTNFKAMKRFIVDEIVKYNNPYPYLEGLTLRTTNKIAMVPMEERDRIAGVGHFTFKKSISLWVNGFTAFSVKPLRISTIIGLICSIIGFIYGLVVVVRRLCNPAIMLGYSSIMAAMLFIGGVIMVMLGMIGEYIGRIYISLNNSPQYVIRDIINKDDD